MTPTFFEIIDILSDYLDDPEIRILKQTNKLFYNFFYNNEKRIYNRLCRINLGVKNFSDLYKKANDDKNKKGLLSSNGAVSIYGDLIMNESRTDNENKVHINGDLVVYGNLIVKGNSVRLQHYE